jgi:hypothetical protein
MPSASSIPKTTIQVLAPLPGVTWTDVVDDEDLDAALAPFEHDPQACVVLDLSTVPQARKVGIIERVLELLRERRQRRGIPHWIILDEAHYSLHRQGIADRVIGIQDKGFCLITYRASWLRESVAQGIDVFLFARTTVTSEHDFLRPVLNGLPASTTAVVSTLQDLPQGEFLLVWPDAVDPRSFHPESCSRRSCPSRRLRDRASWRLVQSRADFPTRVRLFPAGSAYPRDVGVRHEPAFIEPLVARYETKAGPGRFGLSGGTAPNVPVVGAQSGASEVNGWFSLGFSLTWGDLQ